MRALNCDKSGISKPSHRQGVECWIRGNHGNHKNYENHGNPGFRSTPSSNSDHVYLRRSSSNRYGYKRVCVPGHGTIHCSKEGDRPEKGLAVHQQTMPQTMALLKEVRVARLLLSPKREVLDLCKPRVPQTTGSEIPE